MFASSLQLMARRSLAHWKLLSAVVIGVLLAVSIMSATVLYFDSLRNIALQHDLQQQAPSRMDILIETRQSPVNPQSHEEIVKYVETRLESRLGRISAGITTALKSNTFFLANPGDEVPPLADDRRRASFVTVPGIEDHASLISGGWPSRTLPAVGDELLTIDAAVSAEVAEAFGLETGDIFVMAPFWEAAHDRVQARVSGVYQRNEQDDLFWRVFDDALRFGDTSFQFATFIVPEPSMLEALGGYFPSLGSRYGWLVDIETARIHASASERTQDSLESLDDEFRAELDGYRLTSELGIVLSRFDTRLFFNKIPMFVVLVLIVLVVLYYVSTIAGLLVDAQRGEIALLRSRGATSTQIVVVYATEAFVLTAIAIPVGPYLAAGAISVIGSLPWFSDLNNGSALPVEVTASVFRLAALGGLLSLLALLVPAISAGRIGLLEHRMSVARPAKLPVYQRYYLDLALLGLVLFLFWQLQQRGSFVATNIFGEDKVNQLILAVPAIFLVAAGIVLLRIFPISMEILGRFLSSRIMSPITSPVLVLGVWQMARNPAHHARLSLLLILTASLGVFAATFAGTLDQSFVDRVFYETGADFRVTGIQLPVSARGRSVIVENLLRSTEGISGVSPVIRGGGGLISISPVRFDFLGVDSATLPDVAWTRSDFGPKPIGEALRDLDLTDDSGFMIPEDAVSIFARIRPFESNSSVNLLVRLSDADSRIFTLNMGTMAPLGVDTRLERCQPRERPGDPPPWCTMGGSLSLLGLVAGEAPALPLKLEFLAAAKLSDTDGSGRLQPGALVIDEIGIIRGDGTLEVIEAFDDLTRWGSLGTTLNDFGGTITPLRDSSGAPVQGQARFSWGDAPVRKLNGVLAGKLRQLVPVLASDDFLDRTGFKIGDEVDVLLEDREVVIDIVDHIEFFPTLDPNRRPFIVADIRSAWRALGVDQLGDARRVDEYWIAIVPGSEITSRDITSIVAGRQVRSASLRAEQRSDRLNVSDIDPLSAAGWRALLAIAFFAVLVVSAIGFLVHAQVTFQSRRSELALLRATGLSMKQLLGLVMLEQVLVVGAAFAIGAFMGARLGSSIMPFLGTSGEGLSVVPPMIQQINWTSFGITFGIIGIVFAVVIGVLLLTVFRMSIHSVLRMGER
ncbi:MAG: ABC transporter permease [Chloroflexi bacterium]|nr:ABC transporter permease [Chloroflexota bacterium]